MNVFTLCSPDRLVGRPSLRDGGPDELLVTEEHGHELARQACVEDLERQFELMEGKGVLCCKVFW